MRPVVALAAILIAAVASAAEFPWEPDVAGVVIGDLDGLELYDTTATPDTLLADPGITLTAVGSGVSYMLGGLPDAEAGSGEAYRVRFSFEGVPYAVAWPLQAVSIQPQAVSHLFGFSPRPDFPQLAVGDLLPFPGVDVTGLAADPTGATVTFTLLDDDEVAIVDGATGVISDVSSYVSTDGETRWRATLHYEWTPGDTDTACECTFSFRLTLPGSPPRPMTIPPPRSWPVRIYSGVE